MEDRISKFKNRNLEDDGGVGGCAVHFSPWIHQEYTLRHRSACRKPVESGEEYLTSRKEYIELSKLGRTKELGEETRSVSRTGPALDGWGN